MRIAQKPTVQPMMRFSHLICRGELHLEPNFLKKYIRQILSYFWSLVFLVFRKSVLQILFYFAWMLNQSKFLIPEILRWDHIGRKFLEKKQNFCKGTVLFSHGAVVNGSLWSSMLGCLHQFQTFQLSHPQTLTISLGNLQMGQFFWEQKFLNKITRTIFSSG